MGELEAQGLLGGGQAQASIPSARPSLIHSVVSFPQVSGNFKQPTAPPAAAGLSQVARPGSPDMSNTMPPIGTLRRVDAMPNPFSGETPFGSIQSIQQNSDYTPERVRQRVAAQRAMEAARQQFFSGQGQPSSGPFWSHFRSSMSDMMNRNPGPNPGAIQNLPNTNPSQPDAAQNFSGGSGGSWDAPDMGGSGGSWDAPTPAVSQPAPAATGGAMLPATPPAGVNPNSLPRYTYGFGAGQQGNPNLLNNILSRRGISSDLTTIQPQQPMDAAAQLQGRLTASGMPYTMPTHRSFNVDGQPAPINNPFGTTAQKMERGAGTGTLSGGSTVTVTPEGRAIVRGNMSPRRLAVLGIDQNPVYQNHTFTGEFQSGDRSRLNARQAYNTRRMKNKLLARRMGIENPAGDTPIQPGGASLADMQAGLSQQNAARDNLMQTQRNARRPTASTPANQQQPPEQQNGPSMTARANNYEDQVFGSILQQRPDMSIADARAEARAMRQDRFGDRPDGTNSSAPVSIPAIVESSTNGMTWPEAEQWLTDQRYGNDIKEAVKKKILANTTPAQRSTQENTARNQVRDRNRRNAVTQEQNRVRSVYGIPTGGY